MEQLFLVSVIYNIYLMYMFGGKSGTMEKTIRAEYVCNAGILLYFADYVIGVDVFASCENGIYRNTPSRQRETIFRLIRENRLKLLIFTHYHCDHYCRADVLEAMRTAAENDNPLRILTTGQTAEDLIAGGADPARVVICSESSCYDGFGQPSKEEPGGVKITGFYTRHDGHQYENVENLVFLMTYSGQKIIFTGDAAPDAVLFERIGHWSKQIDRMFVPFPFVGLVSARKKMEKELQVKQVAAFHLPRPECDSQGWYANTCKVCAQAKDSLPEPVFLTDPGTDFS